MFKSSLLALILTASVSHADSFDCYLAAVDKVSPPSSAVTLCEGMTSNTNPVACFNQGSNAAGIGPSVAFRLCTRSSSVDGPLTCFLKLKSQSVDGLQVGDSVGSTLCHGSDGSEDDLKTRLQCWGESRKVGTLGRPPGFAVDPGLAAKLCATK